MRVPGSKSPGDPGHIRQKNYPFQRLTILLNEGSPGRSRNLDIIKTLLRRLNTKQLSNYIDRIIILRAIQEAL